MPDSFELAFGSLSRSERQSLRTIVRIGQFGLARQLAAEGLSEQDLDVFFAGFLSRIPDEAARAIGQDELKAIIASVDKALDDAKDIPEVQDIVDFGAEQAEQEAPAVSLAAGEGRGGAKASLAYAAIVLLVLAKLGGHYDFKTGEGYVDFAPGVPVGVPELVKSVGAVVSSSFRATYGRAPSPPSGAAQPQSPGPPLSGDPRPPASGDASTSQREEKSGTGAEVSSAVATISRVPVVAGPLDLPQVSEGRYLTFEQGLEIAQRVVDFFDRRGLLEACGIDYRSEKVFGSAEGFGRGRRWPYDQPIKVGAGLLRPEPNSADPNSADPNSYRVAVRLQSQFELQKPILRRIAKWFDSRSDGLVSVRWTSRIVSLASNPGGHLWTWAGAEALKSGPVSGAAINVAGGVVGAVTLLAMKDRAVHLLTAGHVVQDDRADVPVGARLYSPVQDNTPANAPAAIVVAASLFAPYFPGRNYANPAAVDYALARVETGNVPVKSMIDSVEGQKISLPPASAEAAARPRAMKGPARTGSCFGRIESVETDVIVANEISGTEYFGRRLIEVSLDRNRAIKSGDSGALLLVETAAGFRPAGMVVAGALNSRLRGSTSEMTSALYAVPLTAIPGIESMEAV